MKKSTSNIAVSVVIPTYNEVESIVNLIKQVKKTLGKYTYEIIVIDDHSPDQTLQQIVANFTNDPRVRVYYHQGSPELAGSILQGIEAAKGELIVGMDADFNHDPEVIAQILVGLTRADLVVASRFIQGGGMENSFRYWTSFAYNILLRVLLGFPSTDNTSGFYGIKRDLLKALPLTRIYKGYGEYHLRLVYEAKKADYRLKEVPVFYKNRLAGVSKSKFGQMLIHYTWAAIQVRFS